MLCIAFSSAHAGDARRGSQIFQQHCSICHSDVRQGPDNFGPNLFGVVGRKPGSLAGFDYSPAMKANRIAWSSDRLERYIEAPGALIPGARMRFVGPQEAAAREDLVAYLATLK